MLNDLLIWVALSVGLVFLAVDKRRGIGALTLAYFLLLSLGHVPGVLAYLDPNMIPDSVEATTVGFDVTLIGMTAFILGAMAARIMPRKTTSTTAYQQTADADIFSRIGARTLTMGIASYFVLEPISALVPSSTAVIIALATLILLGFWLRIYTAVTTHDRWMTLWILATLPLFPLATLVTGGFMGFGTAWALSIVVFHFVIARRRIWFYLATPPVIFLGLSLCVTYLLQRNDIRSVVWDQNTGPIQRLDKVSKLITDFQLLDLSNEKQLLALDARLNQNSLVGVGVMRHREGAAELWYGATVGLWALIPRAIWPDKPPVGGGQELVSQFTGITFAQGTSVGAGQVLEFYMNFGMPGVLAGFAVLGFILMRLDQGVMRAVAMRNINGVVQLALPGLALLQPLGNLLEIVVSVVAAIITSQILIRSKLLSSPSTRSPRSKMSGRTRRMVQR